MSKEFKSIVFFGTEFSQYPFMKKEFAPYPSVQVYQSAIVDEIGQILTQSTLSAIIIKHTQYINQLVSEDIFSMKKAGVRFYFLNKDPQLGRAEIERLSGMKITTLTGLSDVDLRTKLEMFILSKLRIAEKPKDAGEVEGAPKQSYFTYLKKLNGQWTVYVSTHEQEREIETLFEKSWTVYCTDLITQADSFNGIQEDPDFSKDYLSIIYPHQHPDESRGLSIMHVKKDAAFAETYMRALTFLAKI